MSAHTVTVYNAAYVARLESDRDKLAKALRGVGDKTISRKAARRVLSECALPLPDKFDPRKDEE